MKNRSTRSRWRPLIIGPLLILVLSFLCTGIESIRFEWNWDTYAYVSLSTAAGPFAFVGTTDLYAERIVYGIFLVCAMLVYSIHPSRATACITIIGFMLWLVIGFALTRVGV
jgi:hypothetical protein